MTSGTKYPPATSPWSLLHDATSMRVEPIDRKNIPSKASLAVPGSKSVSNRALIIASLANGTSNLSYLLESDDTYWCVEGLKSLGCEVKISESAQSEKLVQITGCGGRYQAPGEAIFIGAAGTVARFLPGALASCRIEPKVSWQLDPDHSLAKRPIKPLVEAIESLGGRVEFLKEADHYPLKIHSTGLKGGKVQIPGNVSSQYLSGILISAPYNESPLTIEVVGGLVQPRYVDITVKMMQEFGVEVERPTDSSFLVHPSTYEGRDYQVEGDASSAGYLFAFAALHGIEITVENVGSDSSQPDIDLVKILEHLGCEVKISPTKTTVKGPKKLKGGKSFDLNAISDQTPTLAAVAPFCEGGLELRGVEHIRKHECDRISAMKTNLEKAGIEVTEFPDGLKVAEGNPASAIMETYADHRIAMSMSLVASKSNPLEILDPNCVAKTFPNFFEVMKSLGVNCDAKKD